MGGLAKDGGSTCLSRWGRAGRGSGSSEPRRATPMDRCRPMPEASQPSSTPESDREAHGGRLLLVGARRQVWRLAGCLDEGSWAGLRIVGFVDATGRGRQLVV